MNECVIEIYGVHFTLASRFVCGCCYAIIVMYLMRLNQYVKIYKLMYNGYAYNC